MRKQIVRITIFVALLCSAAAAAQAQACVRIDESQDTLAENDRAAAVLLLTREFARAGEPATADCPTPYRLAHIKIGNTIVVLLSGPLGSRNGTALGLDDLPPLYSQMVRSLVTGRPMTGLAVVDRTNVTAAQATAERVHSDAFTYARLGYGGIHGGRTYPTPSFGFGYRAELDRLAIDVSFLNLQIAQSDYYSPSGSASGTALVRLSGLYLLNRDANSTPYIGGGLSWGRTSIDDGHPVQVTRAGAGPDTVYYYSAGGTGSGLQGVLTAGYELGRATTIRMFLQADATLPFYTVTSRTISSRGDVSAPTRRYTPSLVVSVGLGWQRHRR